MANEFTQGFCPVCNGNLLVYGEQEICGEQISFEYKCMDCKFEGYEWYDIVFGSHSAKDGREINEHKQTK